MCMAHAHLAARVLGTPLLIASSKLDAILAVLGPRLGLDLPAPVPGPETEPKQRERARVEARIAHVQIVGTLAHRVGGLDAMSGATDYQQLGEEIDRLAADPDVDGILLEVDSFGGEAAGCFDLADRIHKAAQAKPVYGVASQYAMSAGYALLSQATRVFVPQSGEVGSIGVVTTHMDLTAAAAQQGVRVTHVYAGARKVDMSPFAALSDEAKARLAGDVSQLYEQFVGVVARGRPGLTPEQVRATEAGTYIGERAVQIGLADEVGDVAQARAALEERIHMKELEQARADLARTQADLAAARAEVEAKAKAMAVLEATAREHEKALAEFRAEAEARRQKDLDAVVGQLVADCKAAGVTEPDKAERDEIRAALEINEALGRKLADAVKARCLATVARAKGKTHSLEPVSEAEAKRKQFVAGVGAPAGGTKKEQV